MSSDPWAFQRWAYGQSTGNSSRKSVFSALATMADCQTGRCEALQATLAQQTEMSERSVRGHLAALAEAGLIARRHQYRLDGSRRGDQFLLLAPWVSEWPDGYPLPGAEVQEELPARSDTHNRQPAAAQERPPENDHSKRGKPPVSPDDIKQVWACYQAAVPNGNQYTLNPTRKGIIERALKVRDVDRCCLAVQGLATSSYHLEGGYMDIRYALRGKPRDGESDDERIDKMAKRATEAKAGPKPRNARFVKKSDTPPEF